MAYNTPPSRNTNDTITAIIWNADIVANEVFLATPPSCRATKTGTQSLTSGTATAIAFDSESVNGGFDWPVTGMHDTVTSNSRITIPVAGVYIVGGNLDFASNATGIRELKVRLNGTTDIGPSTLPSANTGADVFGMNISFSYRFAANDFIELFARQTSGGALNVNTLSPTIAAFWAHWRSL